MQREISEHFNTIDELADAAENREPREDAYYRSSIENSSYFTATESLNEACKLARDGMPNAAELIEATAIQTERLRHINDGKRSELKRAHVGGSVNAARAARGLPKSARRIETAPRTAPTLTLVYDSAALSNEDAETITNAGARVLACVKEAERQGVRVALVVCCDTHYGRDESLFMSATVRAAGEPMNIARAAFALTCPSFQRRLGFSWRETNKETRKFISNYGRSMCATDSGRDEAREHYSRFFAGEVVFTSFYTMKRESGLNSLWRDISAAITGEKVSARYA